MRPIAATARTFESAAAACIASAIDAEQAPVLRRWWWVEDANRWLHPRGLYLVSFGIPQELGASEAWTAHLKNGRGLHIRTYSVVTPDGDRPERAVLYRGDEEVHDPLAGEVRVDLAWSGGAVIVPVDPTEYLSRRALRLVGLSRRRRRASRRRC